MKNILFHRDFLLLALLLCMLKIGVEIREPAIGAAPLLHSPATTQIAQAEPVAEPAPQVVQEVVQTDPSNHDDGSWEVSGHEIEKVVVKEPEPFLIHEVDQSVLKQIECAQNQITQALDIAQPASLDSAQLRSLQQKLTQLRTQYQANSPAIAFLGPLGAAAIVLKEEDLERELSNTVKRVASIIHNLAGNEHHPADSIIKELESNHMLLHNLSHA